MARYRFVTWMRFAAAIDDVHRTIVEPERWLDGWGDVVTVARLREGAGDGVGATFEATVRAPVGYRLSARIETVGVAAPVAVAMRATGDLEGTGRWRLRDDDGGTEVRFDWDVATTARWMDLLTPVGRPVFEWSHRIVMRRAARAVARSLGGELLRFRSVPVGRRRRRTTAGALALVAVAGVLLGSRSGGRERRSG